MVWVQVLDAEKSLFDNSSYLVFFDFFGRKCHSIVNDRVLKYLKINEIRKDDYVFVVRTFNRYGEVIYLLKDVKKV